MVAQMAASNAVLQTIVEEEKRGRVMSFYTMAFFGMGPLGSLLSGGACRRHRHLGHLLDVRRDLPHRLAGLYGTAAELPQGDPADVRSSRHSPEPHRGTRRADYLADTAGRPAKASRRLNDGNSAVKSHLLATKRLQSGNLMPIGDGNRSAVSG